MPTPYTTLAGQLEGRGPLAGRLVPFDQVPLEALPAWDIDSKDERWPLVTDNGISTLALDAYGNGWILSLPTQASQFENTVYHRQLQQQLAVFPQLSMVLRARMGFDDDIGELWINDGGQLVQASQSQFQVAGLDVHFDGPRGWHPVPDEYRGTNESAGWVYGVPFVFKLGGKEQTWLCACDCWTRTAYVMRPHDVITAWDIVWATLKGIWDGLQKGFSIGLSIGNSIVPGIGGIIGAIIGAILGAIYGGIMGYRQELSNDLDQADRIAALMKAHAQANAPRGAQGPNLLGGAGGGGGGGAPAGGLQLRAPIARRESSSPLLAIAAIVAIALLVK